MPCFAYLQAWAVNSCGSFDGW